MAPAGAATPGWRNGEGKGWVDSDREEPFLSLPARVREQLQSVQVQWTRVQERSEQRRQQLQASLQLQVRGLLRSSA